MSATTNTMGVPKLLPVTAAFMLPMTLLNTWLQYECIKARISTSTPLGKDCSTSLSEDSAARKPIAISGETGDPMVADPLLVATSMHDNFLQNAPLALLMAACVELNGGDRKVLGWTLGAFTVARISHALGVRGGKATMRFRQMGFFGTLGVFYGLSGWCAQLVKGYWGF